LSSCILKQQHPTPDEDEQAVPAIELQPVMNINNDDIVDDPTVLACVALAKTPHK
jgi:hypothetical protein